LHGVIVSIWQSFENEDLDDYQGDGSGEGSGMSPDKYKGDPIVRTGSVSKYCT